MDDGKAMARMHERRAHVLQIENNALHRQVAEFAGKALALRKANERLLAENTRLKRRLADLTHSSPAGRVPPPAFVKPNVPERPGRKPGRPAGHEAALRPRPGKIDVRQEISLPVDRRGRLCCPDCRTQLSQVRHHRRLVEDMVPVEIITTCYTTHSGYCPHCRKRVESRGEDQPPAADLPHAQLGLHALATAAVLRVCYRLPLRQISQLFADLPGLRISPAAIAKQIQRLGRWLQGQYDRLKWVLRAAGVVHADETGWRTHGKNGYLWTLTNPQHTVYHVDRSRGGQVIAGLLGEAFGGTLVSDFYAAYDPFDCPQQKCLTHLLRELRDTTQKHPALVKHAFFRQCKSLVQEMLRLARRREAMEPAAYARQVKGIETRLGNLADASWDHPEARRLAARLGKYRYRLTTFLHDPRVDGTNNAAERALRPPVVMRKITGGSRSEKALRPGRSWPA